MWPHLMPGRTATLAHAAVVAGHVHRDGTGRAPRPRLVDSDIDRVAVGVAEPEAAAEDVVRRVNLGDAAAPHARADVGEAFLVGAEAQVVEPLLAPLDQEHLVLVAPLAAEGERAPVLGRQQAEGRVEAPASLKVR